MYTFSQGQNSRLSTWMCNWRFAFVGCSVSCNWYFVWLVIFGLEDFIQYGLQWLHYRFSEEKGIVRLMPPTIWNIVPNMIPYLKLQNKIYIIWNIVPCFLMWTISRQTNMQMLSSRELSIFYLKSTFFIALFKWSRLLGTISAISVDFRLLFLHILTCQKSLAYPWWGEVDT